MSSSRACGYETVNFENMLGYHLGSGMTFLCQSDKEYLDIFPFWDWKKLPGTTIIQDADSIPVSNAWGYKIESDFVGGLTNGTNGVAVLQYNRGGLKVSISDPTHTLKNLKIAIEGKYKGENCSFENNKTFIELNLPEDDLAGKTIVFILRK